jgi:hypothetical protein
METLNVKSTRTSYQWGEIYQMFKQETYPELPLPSDETNPDARVYQVIKRSRIHKEAAKPIVMPRTEIISWLINHADVENRLIRNEKGKVITSFQPSSLDVCYKFLRPEVDFTNEMVMQFEFNYHQLLKNRWIKGKALRKRGSCVYPTAHLATPYKITMTLISKPFGEEDATWFKEAWAPLLHQVTKVGTIFNWSSILLDALSHTISKAKYQPTRIPPAFHMSSYLLDVACSTNGFEEMNGSGNPMRNQFMFIARFYGSIDTEFITPRYVSNSWLPCLH